MVAQLHELLWLFRAATADHAERGDRSHLAVHLVPVAVQNPDLFGRLLAALAPGDLGRETPALLDYLADERLPKAASDRLAARVAELSLPRPPAAAPCEPKPKRKVAPTEAALLDGRAAFDHWSATTWDESSGLAAEERQQAAATERIQTRYQNIVALAKLLLAPASFELLRDHRFRNQDHSRTVRNETIDTLSQVFGSPPGPPLSEAGEIANRYVRWRAERTAAFAESNTAITEFLYTGTAEFMGQLAWRPLRHIHIAPSSGSEVEVFSSGYRQQRVIFEAGNRAFARFRYMPGQFVNDGVHVLRGWGWPLTAILFVTPSYIHGKLSSNTTMLLTRDPGERRWRLQRLYHFAKSRAAPSWQLGSVLIKDERQLPHLALAPKHCRTDVRDFSAEHRKLLMGRDGFVYNRTRIIETVTKFAKRIRSTDHDGLSPLELAHWIDETLLKYR